MATVNLPLLDQALTDDMVALRDVGWEGYKTLLRIRGDRPRPRMVYLDGTVYLMSPSQPHEELADRMGDLVKIVALELEIPCKCLGSTTFRRKVKEIGVEGDKTFYLANAQRILGKVKINLSVDPPPDLAIEAVYSHGAEAALEVYRRLRVPEVWVADQARLVIHILGARNRYRESAASRSFPFLTADEIHSWLVRDRDVLDNVWLKSLRAWASETLKPRAADRQTEEPGTIG